MRDEIIRAALNDPDNYYDPEEGVLYGPGYSGDGNRIELARFNRRDLTERYGGPLPAWMARRGYKLWDVVGNQYDPTLPAMVIEEAGLRPVDDPGAVYTWAEIEEDYEDRDMFLDGLVKFVF